jgi:CMD domain protein
MTERDVIDYLAGLTPDSPLTAIRDRKPITRQNAQASFRALFEPVDDSDMTIPERFAIATFVAGLHNEAEFTLFYIAKMSRAGALDTFVKAICEEAERGQTVGPYGAYPDGPLSAEDATGPKFAVTHKRRSALLGPRMIAAMAHVHMLVFHPRDADAAALQRLLDAGWSNAGIVTLSQLVAFLAFQIRAAAGLRTLARSAP